jgi:hypothetical protein
MNRRERKHVEKQLGLQKTRKNETRAQKWARWRDNQENGKRMMEEKANDVATSVHEQEDQKLSVQIQSLSEHIAKTKKIPVIDAMVEAREYYEKIRK